MDKNDINIYAIVVTHNGTKWIERCFSSLIESSVTIQVLTIDNASSDDTVALIREKFPQVSVIETGTNLGFGKANNIGLKKALEENADYVFLLNQDAWVESSTVEKLIEVAELNKEYGIVSPFHLSYDGKTIEKYFNDYVLGHYTLNYLPDKSKNQLKTIYPSNFIHAACWLMSIGTVKLIGGFDPLFFHYGEDNDYVQRLLFRKKLIGFVPDTFVYHFGLNEGLNKPKENINFLINENTLLLKNPKASSMGALLLFFRQFIKIAMNRPTDIVLFRAYKYNLKRLIKIFKSRRSQKQSLAYL